MFRYRVPELDGLRAIAILSIIFYQVFFYILAVKGKAQILSVYGYDVFTLPLNGWIAANFFFVLSGYVISSQLFKPKPVPMHQFIAYRVLKLIPAYYVVLTLCVFGLVPYFKADSTQGIWNSYLYHLMFMNDYTGSDINPVLWSVAVIAKFYVIVPFLVWFIILCHKSLGEYSTLFLMLCMVGLGTYLRITVVPYDDQTLTAQQFYAFYRNPFHACLEPFVLGVMASYIRYLSKVKEKITPHANRIFFTGVLCVVALAFSHPLLRQIGSFDVIAQPPLIAFFMFLIVLGTVLGGAPQGMTDPFLKMVSRFSYSLFLVHAVVMPMALVMAATIVGGASVTILFILAFIFTSFSLTFGLACLLHFLIEWPFLKLRARV